MGFDKLASPFAGVPLARRVALALRALRPLFVAAPHAAAALDGIAEVEIVRTPPTAGQAETLALADRAVARALHLAVLPCDLPFVDAARAAAFVARVPDGADLAWPVVGGVPGHPVLWSPQARARIAQLAPNEPPAALRRDAALCATALDERDDAYVTDVDTPDAWSAAERRALTELRETRGRGEGGAFVEPEHE